MLIATVRHQKRDAGNQHARKLVLFIITPTQQHLHAFDPEAHHPNSQTIPAVLF